MIAMKMLAFVVVSIGLMVGCDSGSMQPNSKEQVLNRARKDSIIVPLPKVDSSTCYTCTRTRLYLSDTSSTVPYVLAKTIVCGEADVKNTLETGNFTQTGSGPYGIPFQVEIKTTCTPY